MAGRVFCIFRMSANKNNEALSRLSGSGRRVISWRDSLRKVFSWQYQLAVCFAFKVQLPITGHHLLSPSGRTHFLFENQEIILSLHPHWLRSTMDSMWVSGTQDLGSIPSGATNKHKNTQAFAWVFYFRRNA